MQCFRRLLVLYLGLLPAAILISGCSHSPNSYFGASSWQAAKAAPAGGVSGVQNNPAYREAVQEYARHDFREALRLLDTLSRQPHLAHDTPAQDFLAYQQLLCRHALNPRVALNQRSLPSPVHPNVIWQADCGPRALLFLCQNAGIRADLAALRRQAGTTPQGTTMQGLAEAAQQHGLKASGVQMDPQALSQLSQPALAWVDGDHYIAVLSVRDGQATVHDPNQDEDQVVPVNQLWSRCGGILLTLSSKG